MSSIFFISLMAGSPWGGSEELWYRTALLAAKKGIRVGCAVYYWPGKEKKMQDLADLGCSIYYLPNKGRSKKNLVERIQNKISKYRLKKIRNTLPVHDYELVVINQGAFEITTPEWRTFYRRLEKFVLLFHNYKEGEVFGHSKAKVISNWTEKAAQNLFASARIREVLEQNSGINITKDAILVNPISFLPPDVQSPYPPVDKGYRFVMLAALDTQRKAQDNLIRSLSGPKWKDRNWTLHLYGEGKDRKYLEKLIQSLNMERKIFLEGQTVAVKNVLENSHLVLQLTHIDAMPLSVVEAMAVGRPVIASRIGDMPLWVKEGVNGWISPDASVEQIENTIERAWKIRDQWPQFCVQAHILFSQKFPTSAEEVFLQTLEKI